MTETDNVAALDATFVPARRDDLAVEELDGELVLLDETTGGIHVLNATASVVWRCLDGDIDVATLAAELADAFGVDASQVSDDVLGMVRQLAADGLLVGFEPPVDEPADDAEPDAADVRAPRFLETPPNS